jgi:hypothetical protein
LALRRQRTVRRKCPSWVDAVEKVLDDGHEH